MNATLPSTVAPMRSLVTVSVDRPTLNFWVFAVPYLIAIAIYFTIIDNEARVVVPLLPIAAILTISVYIGTVERRFPAINREATGFVLAFTAYCIFTALFSEADSGFAARKLGLPLAALAPMIFRYYITPRQLQFYMAALFVVAILFTRLSSDVINDGVFSTDSPFESIISVPFGALTVWLAAQRRYRLAILAFLACMLFYKRNAIGLALMVSGLVFMVQLVWPQAQRRILSTTLLVWTPVLGITSIYLNRIFEFVAANFAQGYDAEFVSVGRAPIWTFVLRNFENSTLREQLLGHGAGSVEELITGERSLAVFLQLAHNEYLSFLFDFGVIGAAFLFVMLLRTRQAGTPAIAVLLYITAAMCIENFFLVSFIALGSFVLLSTHLLPDDMPTSEGR